MFRKVIALGIFFGGLVNESKGQSLAPIQLDRPDQTECPFLTPEKYLQVETGFLYEKITDGVESTSHPSILWKYGLNSRMELRMITALVNVKTDAGSTTGIPPITFGFKTSLIEEKGIVPKISFLGHFTTTTLGSKDFQASYAAPEFRFSFNHTLCEKMTLSYNLGAEWNGETPEHTYVYTLTTGYSITDKLGCFAEVYGFLPADLEADHRVDAGVTYLINNDWIIDVSGGIGLSETSPDYFIGAGISFRFNTVKAYPPIRNEMF